MSQVGQVARSITIQPLNRMQRTVTGFSVPFPWLLDHAVVHCSACHQLDDHVSVPPSKKKTRSSTPRMTLALILILILRRLGHLLICIRTRLPATSLRFRVVIFGATPFVSVGRVLVLALGFPSSVV